MFKIRIGGSSDFVSRIDPYDTRSCPPGSADTVSGWDHPDALQYDTREAAERAAHVVELIEGFHTCVEEIKS